MLNLSSPPLLILPSPSIAYRTGITTADVLAAPVLAALTTIAGSGSLTNATHTVYAVAGNAYGQTSRSNAVTANPGASGQLRVNFTSLPSGYTYVDLYCGTPTDPLYLGRATSTQVTNGDTITATATATANATFTGSGTAGTITTRVVGTGKASSLSSENTAFVIPGVAEISTSGRENIDLEVDFQVGNNWQDSYASIVPFMQSGDSNWYQFEEFTIYNANTLENNRRGNRNRTRIPVRGAANVHFLISRLVGFNASVGLRAIKN